MLAVALEEANANFAAKLIVEDGKFWLEHEEAS